MKKLVIICAVVSVLLIITAPTRADITMMTFEEFLGHDTQPIATYYSGISPHFSPLVI